MKSYNIKVSKLQRINIGQWLIVTGIMFTHYIEALIIFLICMIIAKRNNSKVNISCNIILLLLGILILSVFVITLIGYNYYKCIQQFVLVAFFLISYYVIFEYYKSDLQLIFDKYVKLIFYLCCIGLLQFAVYFIVEVDIFQSFTTSADGSVAITAPHIMRIHSIFSEPSGLSTSSTPAMIYLLLRDKLSFKEKRVRFIIIITIILTFSTVTMVILILGLLYKYVFIYKRWIVRIFIYGVLGGVLVYLFSFVMLDQDKQENSNGVFSDVNLKISDTFNGFHELNPESFELLNLSSYATLSNIWVAINAPSRLVGTGLGTHEQNYYSLYQSGYKYYGLNAQEAYSLLTRVFSEFGILGVIVLLLFVYKNFNAENIINVAVLFIIITLLLRGGHYVRNGTVFFFFLYYYTNGKNVIFNRIFFKSKSDEIFE